MNESDPVKQAWLASAADAVLPELEKVRRGADRFYRRIRLRNRVEYGACVLVVAIFALYAFVLPLAAARIGAALVVLGTFVIAWQLNVRASAQAPPEGEEGGPIIAHHRAQLTRQRDALSSIATWYLLPLVPGMLVMTFAPAIEFGPRVLRALRLSDWLGMASTFAVFLGIWWLNRRQARKLQRAIDELERLEGEGG